MTHFSAKGERKTWGKRGSRGTPALRSSCPGSAIPGSAIPLLFPFPTDVANNYSLARNKAANEPYYLLSGVRAMTQREIYGTESNAFHRNPVCFPWGYHLKN